MLWGKSNVTPFCAAHCKFQICIHILKFREPSWSGFLNISIRNSLFSKCCLAKCCGRRFFSLIIWDPYSESPSDTLSPSTCLKFERRHVCNSPGMLQYWAPSVFFRISLICLLSERHWRESLPTTGKDLDENPMFLTWWREWITGFGKRCLY